MKIRAFRRDDAGPLSELSASCLKGETDFVLNPLWETADELFAEFDRFGIAPEESLLVAEADSGQPAGLAGLLRRAGASDAGLESLQWLRVDGFGKVNQTLQRRVVSRPPKRP